MSFQAFLPQKGFFPKLQIFAESLFFPQNIWDIHQKTGNYQKLLPIRKLVKVSLLPQTSFEH